MYYISNQTAILYFDIEKYNYYIMNIILNIKVNTEVHVLHKKPDCNKAM